MDKFDPIFLKGIVRLDFLRFLLYFSTMLIRSQILGGSSSKVDVERFPSVLGISRFTVLYVQPRELCVIHAATRLCTVSLQCIVSANETRLRRNAVLLYTAASVTALIIRYQVNATDYTSKGYFQREVL